KDLTGTGLRIGAFPEHDAIDTAEVLDPVSPHTRAPNNQLRRIAWKLDLEHDRAEALAVYVLVKGDRHAAAKRVFDNKIEGTQLRQFIAGDRPIRDVGKSLHDPRRRQMLAQQR